MRSRIRSRSKYMSSYYGGRSNHPVQQNAKNNLDEIDMAAAREGSALKKLPKRTKI